MVSRTRDDSGYMRGGRAGSRARRHGLRVARVPAPRASEVRWDEVGVGLGGSSLAEHPFAARRPGKCRGVADATSAHRAAQRWVGKKRRGGGGKRRGVGRETHEKPAFAVCDDIRDARGGGSDHGEARRLREPERLESVAVGGMHAVDPGVRAGGIPAAGWVEGTGA